MTYIPSWAGGSGGGLPVTPDASYATANAIDPAKSLVLLQPAGTFTPAAPMAMTLANGAANSSLIVINDGAGAATITATFNRQANSTLSLYSPNGRGAAWLFYNQSAGSWFVVNVFDPGLRIPDLVTGATPSRTDTTQINQGGSDFKIDAGSLADFALGQGLSSVAISANTALSYATHNRRSLFVTASCTLTVPSASTLTSRFRCDVRTVNGATATLSGAVIKYDGTALSVINPATSASLESDGTTVWGNVGGLGGATSTSSLIVTNLTGLTPSGTSTISMSFNNGAPSGFLAKVDGTTVTVSGVSITTTSGSNSTAAGTASFTITTPTAGAHTLSVSSTGTYATPAADYPFTTSASPVFSGVSVTPLGSGIIGATATGNYANGKPASLTATMDGGALTISNISITTLSGTGATEAGPFSFTFTNPSANGAHTLHIAGTGTYAASTSPDYTYSTVTAALTVNAITAPAPSTSFNVGGTYANFLPTGLQYSTNSTNGSDGTWTTASSPTISGGSSGGSFLFAISAGLTAGVYTLWVRGVTNTQIVDSSNSFTITAAGGTITAPSSSSMGTTATFPVTVTGSGSPTVYASVAIAGVEQGSRTSVSYGSTSVNMSIPSGTPAAMTASLYAASTGGSALATSGSFTPSASGTYYGATALGEPAAWYDFSDATTLFSNTGRTTQASANGSVLGIADKSANGFHLSQATSGNAPVYKTAIQNSKSALLFTKTGSQFLEANASSALNTFLASIKSGDWTILLVAKAVSTTITNTGMVYISTNTLPGYNSIHMGTDNPDTFKANRDAINGASPAAAATDDGVSHGTALVKAVVRFNASTGTIYNKTNSNSEVSNTGATGTNLTGGNAWDTLRLGNYAGGTNYINAYEFEVVIWPTLATSSDRDTLLSLATTKWG